MSLSAAFNIISSTSAVGAYAINIFTLNEIALNLTRRNRSDLDQYANIDLERDLFFIKATPRWCSLPPEYMIILHSFAVVSISLHLVSHTPK